MQIEPYLIFNGRCEEAIEYYREALGAEVKTFIRFKDNPDPQDLGKVPADVEDKILHASFRIGETTINASDGRCLGQPDFQGFSLWLTVPDVVTANRLFSKLAEGGQKQMLMTETFLSPRFGIVTDRFGVSWMIAVAQ